MALPVGPACEVGPRRMKDAEVVGVGQGALLVVAGGEFGVFAVQAVGQHRQRLAYLIVGLLGRLGWKARALPLHPLAARQLRVRPGSRLGSDSRGWIATFAPSMSFTPSWVTATAVSSPAPQVMATYTHSRGSLPVTRAEPPRTWPPWPLCPMTA